MSGEIENEHFKGVYNNLNRTQSFVNQCDNWLSNAKFDFDDDASHASKIREWGRLRGTMKMYLNDIKRNSEVLQREKSNLEKFRTNSNDPSILNDVKIIENKYSHNDLLNSLWNIESQLENKLIFISELQDSERELFNHSSAGDMNSSLNASNIRTCISERSNTRIVSLKVPEFHGQYENYAEFIAGYDDLIHNNPEYSDSAKCMYFKNAIRGKAARIINGIPATGNNYQLMYDKIKAKFSRTSLNNHTILLKLEILLPADENAQSLQDKIDDIEEILNLLNAANIGIDKSTDAMWHRLIFRKFPDRISDKIVEEHHSDENFTIRELISTIENQTFAIKFREEAKISRNAEATQNHRTFYDHQRNDNSLPGRVNENHKPYSSWNMNNTTQPLSNPPSNLNSNNPHQQNVNSPIATRLPKTTNTRNDSYNLPNRNVVNDIPRGCIFCSVDNHTTEECRIPLQMKKNILMENKACWKCFQTDHGSHQCHLPDCPCGNNHHPSLCRHRDQHIRNSWTTGNRTDYTPGKNNASTFQPVSRKDNSELSSLQTHPVIIEEMTDMIPSQQTNENLQVYHTTIENSKVIPVKSVLMTCRALSFNPNIKRYVEASMFFDSGSQRTIVSEKFAKLMKLKIIGKEQCVFRGINGNSDMIERNIVEIKLKDVEGNDVMIHALTKESMYQEFNAAKLDDNDMNFVREHKISIDNSHIKGERICPDILIGADCYNDLVKNIPTTELPSNLRIVKTIFGSTFFGVANNLKDVKAEMSTYANYSCIVNTIPKIGKQGSSKNKIDIKCASDIETTKSVLKVNTFRQSKQKLNRKRDEIIMLPTETISLLKKRTRKRKKLRGARRTSLLKSSRTKQQYENKPSGPDLSLYLTEKSRMLDRRFLKKNKIGSKNLQTLNNTDGRIHPALVHFESETFKTAVNTFEKLGGKDIQ